MNVEDAVMEKLRTLSPEEKQQVLDFVTTLVGQKAAQRPRRDLMGLFADLGVHISDEEIAEARHEMWGNFPREDV
jgi:hypothetical protein